jgi:phosphonate transport system substrate-binding protein
MGGDRRAARLRLWALGLAFFATSAIAEVKAYQFGVFPYLPLTKIHELYTPMARDFEAKLGRPVQLGSRSGYAAFAEDLRRQTYDIALVQPFDYVDAHDKHHYLPLARRSSDLEALIVVRSDSPLRTIHDLKGKIVANPPADAAVSHLTSMAFWQAGIHPSAEVKRHYERNHLACLQSVRIGAADACATADQLLRTLEGQIQPASEFRVLHKTGSIPHAVFVVHKRVSRNGRDALLKTILGWSRSEEGRRILEHGRFLPFIAAKDADYDVVRQYVRGSK